MAEKYTGTKVRSPFQVEFKEPYYQAMTEGNPSWTPPPPVELQLTSGQQRFIKEILSSSDVPNIAEAARNANFGEANARATYAQYHEALLLPAGSKLRKLQEEQACRPRRATETANATATKTEVEKSPYTITFKEPYYQAATQRDPSWLPPQAAIEILVTPKQLEFFQSLLRNRTIPDIKTAAEAANIAERYARRVYTKFQAELHLPTMSELQKLRAQQAKKEADYASGRRRKKQVDITNATEEDFHTQTRKDVWAVLGLQLGVKMLSRTGKLVHFDDLIPSSRDVSGSIINFLSKKTYQQLFLKDGILFIKDIHKMQTDEIQNIEELTHRLAQFIQRTYDNSNERLPEEITTQELATSLIYEFLAMPVREEDYLRTEE